MSCLWRSSAAVNTAGQIYLTKHKLRFCASTNPTGGVSKICDGHNLQQCSRLEIRLIVFCRSTITQKQFIHHQHYHFSIFMHIQPLGEKCPNTELFLVRIFLYSDWIRRDTEYLSVFSPNTGKCGPEITQYLDTFHAVLYDKILE